MKKSTSFYRANLNLLGFGFLFTFLSSFGQTFLLSLYMPSIQGYFQISDSLYSGIYALATLMSAASLVILGKYIDRIRLHLFSIRVLIGLVIANIVLSLSYHLVLLFLGMYLLRLFGQALSTHTALTSMGRFFKVNRGKALGIAVLGHPLGEAVLPILVISMITWVGWRYSLLLQSGFVMLAIPLVIWLLLKDKRFSRLKMFVPFQQTASERKEGRPSAVIKRKAFWILAPSNFASGSIGTAVLFFQLKIGSEKGWDPKLMAASFVAYALGSAVFTLIAGFLTDRFHARKLYPLYLVPFMIGMFVFLLYDGIWVYTLLVGMIGVTNGFGGVLKNAAIPELFGIKNLGAVRSFFTTFMVFSTAIGPVLFGSLLDIGVSFQWLFAGGLLFMSLISLNALRIYSLKPDNTLSK